MSDNSSNSPNRDEFLFPRASYHGDFTPQNLVFNSNLQEFAQRVNYVCNLETAGKLSSEAAYQKIKQLWKELKTSRKALGIGEESPPPEE
ncbi:MAG: hypothetical protein AAGA60_26720 [Cyanobacteria bacterium P01_E01_bin.42]